MSAASQVGLLPGPVDLLTAEEVAALLAVSTRTLANWRVLRKGPRWIRLGERCIRYSRADLSAFIASGEGGA